MPYLNHTTNKILGSQLIIAEHSYIILNKASDGSEKSETFKYVDQKYTNSDCKVFCTKNSMAYLLEAQLSPILS